MTGPITGVGGAVTHDLTAFALNEPTDRAFAARQAADPTALGRDLLDGVQAASDNYRRSLALALEPSALLTQGVSGAAPLGAARSGASAQALSAAGAFPAAPSPARAAVVNPSTSAPAAADAPGGPQAALLPQTEQATEASLQLLLTAHQQIMKRQVGVMSATTTLDAASSGARRSAQNIDTLLRGQ